MRELVLVRHAEAAAAATSDFDRKLTARGEEQARALGRWLASATAPPQLVWCSAAARTKRTLELFAPHTRSAAVDVDRELYGASAATVVAGIRVIEPAARSALVVFHNPAVAQVAAFLDPGSGSDLSVAPATAIVVRFKGPWSDCDADAVDEFVVRGGY